MASADPACAIAGRATGIFLAAICDTLRSNKLSVEQAVGVSSVEMALVLTYDLCALLITAFNFHLYIYTKCAICV